MLNIQGNPQWFWECKKSHRIERKKSESRGFKNFSIMSLFILIRSHNETWNSRRLSNLFWQVYHKLRLSANWPDAAGRAHSGPKIPLGYSSDTLFKHTFSLTFFHSFFLPEYRRSHNFHGRMIGFIARRNSYGKMVSLFLPLPLHSFL